MLNNQISEVTKTAVIMIFFFQTTLDSSGISLGFDSLHKAGMLVFVYKQDPHQTDPVFSPDSGFMIRSCDSKDTHHTDDYPIGSNSCSNNNSQSIRMFNKHKKQFLGCWFHLKTKAGCRLYDFSTVAPF